ncbi:MAG: hypothetical protein R2705_08115 [Ilumatobacteraceae bacterium]
MAGAGVIGLFLVTSILSGVLVGDNFTTGSGFALINILAMPLYLRDVIFLGRLDEASPLSGVTNGVRYAAVYLVVVTSGLALLLRRYRWTER